MKIEDLNPGQQAILSEVTTDDLRLKRRLEAMGFKKGQTIKVLRRAWLKGPVHIKVGLTTQIAMRRSEARWLELVPEDEWHEHN